MKKKKNNPDEKMIKETLERMLKNPYIKNNLFAVESIIEDYGKKYDLTKYRKIYETLKNE